MDRPDERPDDALRSTAAAMERLVAGVSGDMWSAPTPCSLWTVADLIDHVIAGNRRFASALLETQAQAAAVSGADRLTEFQRSSQELQEAFSAPGALERIVTVPFGRVPGTVALQLRITEFLVHGWDLAHASGATLDVPDTVARRELEFSRGALLQLPPDRRPFDPPQPVDDGAGALDQLVALLGRRV